MAKALNTTFACTALLACLALSACTKPPVEAELKAAVERKMTSDREALERKIGPQAMPPAKPVLRNLRKLGCKEDAEKAYRCEGELEVSHGDAGATGTASMRFVRTNNGWVASN